MLNSDATDTESIEILKYILNLNFQTLVKDSFSTDVW